MIRGWAFLLLVTTCLGDPLFAQSSGLQLSFQHLTQEEGLTNSTNSNVYKDSRGLVWISSIDGLNRYNGSSVKAFRPDAGDSTALSGNNITSTFYEDRSGNLWFTTYGALQCYHRTHDRFSRIVLRDQAGEEQQEDFHAFAFDTTIQKLWVRTGQGPRGLLHEIDVRSGKCVIKGPLDGQRHAILEDDTQGRMIISSYITRPGLSIQYAGDDSSSIRTYFDGKGTLPGLQIYNLLAKSKSEIYFGTQEGLGKFNLLTGEFELFQGLENGTSTGRIWSMVIWGNELLVTSEKTGLLVFDPQQERFTQSLTANKEDRYALRSNDLREVYLDRSGCIWISIWGEGIDFACIGKRRFAILEWDQLGLSPPIISFNEDAEGNISMADSRGKIVQSPQMVPGEQLWLTSLGMDKVELIFQDRRDRHWVSGRIAGKPQRKIVMLENGKETARGTSPGRIVQFYEQSNGSLLAASREGVLSLTVKKGSIEIRSEDMLAAYEEKPVHRIFELEDRLYLAINFDRLLVYEIEQGGVEFEFDLGGTGNVKAIIRSDVDSIVWVAGSKGLAKLNTTNFSIQPVLGESRKLLQESIYAMQSDEQGKLWFKTENEMVSYDPVGDHVQRYSQADGIQLHSDLDMLSWKDNSGRIWMGGRRGLTVFDPKDLAQFTTPAEPIITDLWINDRPWKSDTTATEVQSLDLPYRDNTLMIFFAPGEYSDPKAAQHRYRLHEHDDGWVYGAGAGSARYPNLPWGSYRFTLQVANSDGIWTDPGRSLSLKISPPWWGTWWARVLYILLALVGMHQIYLWRTRVQRRKIAQQTLLLEQERSVNERLRQVDLLKDQFLANTSHELRTPLSGIIGLAESLMDGATGDLARETKANLGMIAASGKRLAHLVDDILDFSKLKNADLNLHLIPVDLHGATDLAMQLLAPLADAKGLSLENQIDTSFCFVEADENRLQQILVNLIGNGIKFTPEGKVFVSAVEQEDEVRILVRDTGMGIRKEKLGEIFQSFEQGDGSAEREFGGTGLGLAISKKLVELHGGSIQVESQPGQGSTFTFTLKKSSATPTPKETASEMNVVSESTGQIEDRDLELVPATSGHTERLRILAVDDEQVNIQVLKNHLSLVGFDVIAANSGDQALQMMEEQGPFDLVLLDVMMPRMTGYQVCEIWRKKYLPSELPIIMLTAKNQTVDLVQAFDVGANDYLSKPFAKDELLSRIKTHMRLHNIYKATGKFVPHHFLKTIGREEITEVRLGDHSICRDISVMFADIRNYTPLSETMTPEDNFQFVNAFAGRMGPIIEKYQGFVNQHLGDAVMAIFPGSTDLVVQASREMQQAMLKYSVERAEVGRSPIRIGIGVHTGTLIMGIIGYSNHIETATVSDTVNIASRIEGLTKYFGANTVISETTRDLMDHPEDLRCLGTVRVKGKRDPIKVFECFDGDPSEMIEAKRATLDQFTTALTFFEEGNMVMAESILSEIVSKHPQDFPAAKLLSSTQSFLKGEVPDQWDGIQILTTKL